jgi:hypothetical protein
MLSFDDLSIPDDWPLLLGVDTGAYMSALLVAFCPDPYAALALAEFPNYRYVGGEIELLGSANSEWARTVVNAYRHLRPGTSRVHGWVDQNSQFKQELSHYGLALQSNLRKLELRVEISREYVQAHDPPRFYLAPWLSVLPYEMEYAHWPDEATSAGKFERIKQNDHTLDCLEHVLSRRPRTKAVLGPVKESFLDRYLREHGRPDRVLRHGAGDPHLGRV